MKKLLAISLVLLVVLVAATVAGAKEIEHRVPMLLDPSTRGVPMPGVMGANQAGTDTFYYGGTVVAGGQAFAAAPTAAGRANAKLWTWGAGGWNGTPHSGRNMDGWTGMDNTAQTTNYFRVMNNTTLGQNCVIGGTKSLFCGATTAEVATLCFVDQGGTGYGNNWNQQVAAPSATYNGTEQISVSYSYTHETEPGYDYVYVILEIYDTGAGEWVVYDTLATYDDIGSGTEVLDVDSYLAGGPPTPVDFRVLFHFIADGGSSDEDGYYPGICSAFAMDDYSMVVNGSTYTQNFESASVGGLPTGWVKVIAGCGDYARVEHLNNLPVPLSTDPCVAAVPQLCSVADSVAVMFDPDTPDYPHLLCQDNWLLSPIIDFSAHPGLPGRTAEWDQFLNMPFNDHIFVYWQIRYSPGCESGGWSPWLSDNYVYYSTEGVQCFSPVAFDVSAYLPPSAEKAQLCLATLNYCDEDPWALGCTYTCNVTPYFDNVTFGVFGSEVAPYISMRELDYFQDQFTEDGTLNPAATADTRIPNYLSNLVPPIFGDTLVCQGSADDMEVWFVFRMAKIGPQQSGTAPFFTDWFPGVTGGGWYEARMDTSRATSTDGTSTVTVPDVFMCAFHEQDPTRLAEGLAEGTEILPNQLFVPGTRIEYYLKACYAGSADTFYLPNAVPPEDPYYEFEVLPMMVSDGLGSVKWPCLLVADHFAQRGNNFEWNSDRIGRHLSNNDYEFDMFGKLGPSSDLRNGLGRWAANTGQVGGPGTSKYNWGPGATLYQMLAYTHCFMNTGGQYGYSMYQADADMLASWLVTYTDAEHQRFFWLSGGQVTRELNRRTAWGKPFLNNVMCATYGGWSYSHATNDFTYCLPANGIAGGAIHCSDPELFYIRSNGCYTKFNYLGLSSSAGCGGTAEIEYDSRTPDKIAAISNAPANAHYKTFIEAYDDCRVRTNDGLGPLACGPDGYLTNWFSAVLTWGGYNASGTCGPGTVVDVKEPGAVPAVVTSLGQAFPNPMNPTATIKYTIGTPGKVQLRVFDVSGRVIRTLVDETKTAGSFSVMWDGKNDGGERVASGVFFYQLNAPGSELNKKIVILQ